MKVVVVSGRAGAGKSVALNAFEDIGFYCIDNLPLTLLVDLVHKVNRDIAQVAVSIDSRNLPMELKKFEEVKATLKKLNVDFQILYLDTDENILLKRFSETRRRHPLTHLGMSLTEAIAAESDILEPIANAADLYIDTTSLSATGLKTAIRDRLFKDDDGLALLFQSFGFKHGVPKDADFVFDARCLPNPYWDENLREFTGQDALVIAFLEGHPIVKEFVWQVQMFLQTWLPRIEQTQRSYVTIAVGCTGGKHRSVYVIEQLGAFFGSEKVNMGNYSKANLKIRHRESKDWHKKH